MSLLVAIEGADGAGKHTAAVNTRDELIASGFSACVLSFPRYRETVGGHVLGEFLSGRLPVAASPKAAAVLYALDRLESVDVVAEAAAAHDVVIFDRYVASNVVYQASKVPASEARSLMRWVWDLEIETFGVKEPDVSIYLDTSLACASELMLLKQRRSYTERTLDEHEADLTLQLRVRENYQELAEDGHFGRWHVIRSDADGVLRSPKDIAQQIVDHLKTYLADTSETPKRRVTA